MLGKEVLMFEGAKKIVRICATVSKGEKVFIITDYDKIQIAHIIAGVLSEEEVKPTMAVMFPNEFSGQEPPEIISEAMLKADVIIMPVKRSISHSEAVHNALKRGVRVLALSGMTEEQLCTGGIKADFIKQRSECERFGRYFTTSKQIKIISSEGTNFSANIEGRKGNSHSCIVDKPGTYSAVPNIEANVSPVEETSEGIVVIDGGIPNFGIVYPKDPIKMKVKAGRVEEISGGSEAIFVKNLLAEIGDPTVFNIAQIAIGLNPEIKIMTGIGSSDHGMYGSVHIGLGTSCNLGGKVKAPLHFDVLLCKPTVFFDDKKVIDHGEVIG